jgi:OmpA-OmpF porin, OOP family
LEIFWTKEQVITSFEIFYDFDVFELTKRNRQQIQELAFDHKSTANRKILISSFTDVKGKNEYNLKLSKKRSLAVQDELVKNGFPIEQIELEYYGKRVPQNMEPLSDAKRRKSLIIVYEKK